MEKGLYSSAYEHDACGVGMVVNIHGNKSHELVDNALKVLENMRHRVYLSMRKQELPSRHLEYVKHLRIMNQGLDYQELRSEEHTSELQSH